MIKSFKKGLIAMMAIGTFLGAGLTAEASTIHTVKQGDSLYNIGMQYGVSVLDLQSNNHLNSSLIYPGQKLKLPKSISQSEKDLLARLVTAEAKGESYPGKVAVATVVLNRVDHPDFPNTVREVIYSMDGGYYAFTPVANGQINQSADTESTKAVNEALAFRGQGNGSLYFYNPAISSSKWILSRPLTLTIGNHNFAK